MPDLGRPAHGVGGGAAAGKDTEAPVGDGQVPEVDAQVICRHVRLTVAVDGDGVDVVGVAIGEDPPRAHLHHQVHGLQHWHLWKRRGGQSWERRVGVGGGEGNGGGVLAGNIQGRVIRTLGVQPASVHPAWVRSKQCHVATSIVTALQERLPPLRGLLGLLCDFE